MGCETPDVAGDPGLSDPSLSRSGPPTSGAMSAGPVEALTFRHSAIVLQLGARPLLEVRPARL
eukprot:3049550-Pyramimonas_sp.AAC.1